MDVTALGTLLLGVGAMVGAAVTYVGKRGENNTNRQASTHALISAELDQVQEERDGLRAQVQQKDERIAELLQARLTDQVEMARLRVRIIEMGGNP